MRIALCKISLRHATFRCIEFEHLHEQAKKSFTYLKENYDSYDMFASKQNVVLPYSNFPPLLCICKSRYDRDVELR